MKKKLVIITILVFLIVLSNVIFTKKEKVVEEKELLVEEIPVREEVYDNLTREELINKLDNFMKHELAGTTTFFVDRCLSLNVDPYIALAIVFVEAGCYYSECSYNLRTCNNVGGMVGGSCNGIFQKFDTIEDGLAAHIYNLFYGYFRIGLNTPELMNTKYAADPNWANKVNNYVNVIKNN